VAAIERAKMDAEMHPISTRETERRNRDDDQSGARNTGVTANGEGVVTATDASSITEMSSEDRDRARHIQEKKLKVISGAGKLARIALQLLSTAAVLLGLLAHHRLDMKCAPSEARK
jgi:hypothetical protein